jgi:hypothetical protein
MLVRGSRSIDQLILVPLLIIPGLNLNFWTNMAEFYIREARVEDVVSTWLSAVNRTSLIAGQQTLLDLIKELVCAIQSSIPHGDVISERTIGQI